MHVYLFFAGNDTIIEQQNDNEFNEREITNGNGQSTSPSSSPTLTTKPLSRSGNFVVLNRSTLSQMKTLKHIPAGKIKKLIFPSCDSGATNPATVAATTTSTTTVSKRVHSVTLNNSMSPTPLQQQQQQPTPIRANKMHPLSVDPSVRVTHMEGFKRLIPNQNHTNSITNNITISTNGRPKSPKSGILIKRNHLKNFTMRKLNVVRSTKGSDDTKVSSDEDANNNKNHMIRRTVQFSINNNSKDGKNHRSLKTLIADLEN